MEVKNLLPIGSVVLLKGGKKRVMIFGVKQTNTEDNVEFDYIGVFYPEGNMGDIGHFLFNHSDIDQVFFKGFEDDERKEFIQKLDEFYAGQESSDVIQ